MRIHAYLAARRLLAPSLLTLSLLAGGSPNARGVEYTWKPGSGLWATPSRWSPLFGPPNAGDNAVIANWVDATNYQVNLGADVLGTQSPAQLSLGNHGRLDTNGYRMAIDGPAYLFNEGSLLDVRGVASDAAAWGWQSNRLDLSAGAILRMNDGRARAEDITMSHGVILMNGNSRLQAGTQTFIGDGLGNLDANLIVGVGAEATLSGPVRFEADADVSIGLHGQLRTAGNTTFAGGRYNGSGLFRLDGATTTVQQNTMIEMPSGRVDLDGSEEPLAAGQSLVVNADLTVNALMIDEANNSFGASRLIGQDVIQINNWGKLGINLTNANTAWTMRGHLDINAVSGQVISHNISGSPLYLTGTANVQGNSAWSALTEVAGSIQVEADSHLRFSGGDLDHPNLMSGGSIQGPGTLGSLANQKLSGHGTIGTTIRFLGNSELRASGGTLTLTPASNLQVVGTIGTDDPSGTLEIQQAWNTSVATTALELQGGKLTGGTVTNDGTTRGFGRIESKTFINNGVLHAQGISMVIDTAADPDLDGNQIFLAGTVNVTNGNLIVTRPLHDSFNGVMNVNAANWATFEQGWRLEHSVLNLVPTGVLNLHGSHVALGAAVVAGGLQEMAGIINVDEVGAFHAPTEFLSTVQVNLPGSQDWLQLFEPSAITAGAFFAGNGQLRNMEDNHLLLRANANVGVTLHNRGRLEVADAVDDARVARMTTTSTATLDLSIFGEEPSLFDTLHVTGAAQLAGELSVVSNEAASTYLDPTVRGESDSFLLINAGSRTGFFSQFTYNGTLLNPSFSAGSTMRYHAGSGLFHNLAYGAQQVELTNYLAISGDANGDGSFDSGDFVQVFQAGEYEDNVAGNSDWTEGDWDGDGDFTSSDFIAAFQAGYYEQGSVLPAVRAVPEPGTASLLLLGLAGLLNRRKK